VLGADADAFRALKAFAAGGAVGLAGRKAEGAGGLAGGKGASPATAAPRTPLDAEAAGQAMGRERQRDGLRTQIPAPDTLADKAFQDEQGGKYECAERWCAGKDRQLKNLGIPARHGELVQPGFGQKQ